MEFVSILEQIICFKLARRIQSQSEKNIEWFLFR